MDHGADAINVVSSVTADVAKGAMEITAEGLKQLLLLALDKKKQNLQFGETNMDRLIRSLEAGDRTESAVIPTEKLAELAQAAQKHGIVYVVAESNIDDNNVVYYRASEEDRMKNALEEIQALAFKESDRDQEVIPEVHEAEMTPDTVQEPIAEQPLEQEQIKRLEDLMDPQDVKGFQTIALFDRDKPNNYVEISQYEQDGQPMAAAFIYRDGEQIGQGEVTFSAALNELSGYENMRELKVREPVAKEDLQKKLKSASRRRRMKDLEETTKNRDELKDGQKQGEQSKTNTAKTKDKQEKDKGER